MVRKLKGTKTAGGNQADIVKQAQVMQQQMLEVQEQLKSKEVSSSVGGGAVSVKVNGQKELIEVKLSDELLEIFKKTHYIYFIRLLRSKEGLGAKNECSYCKQKRKAFL